MVISNKKREVEKKKVQKKKDKQRRKEDRQKNGPSSFDDMIAYVDVNGNLSDTPPIPGDVEEIELDSIEISVPKQQEMPEEVREGHVDYFNEDKGFGFIHQKDSSAEYFFHISNAPADIAKGDRVSFDIEKGAKGMNAINIQRIKS